MNYARHEKRRLLAWLLPLLSADQILALELPFRDVRHKADVAVLAQDKMLGIEVKGPRDNLGKLPNQISAYQEMFTSVAIAVADRHIEKARLLTPRSVGIIRLGAGEIDWERRPRSRRQLSKSGALAWLHRSDLERLLRRHGIKGSDVEQMKALAEKKIPQAELSMAAMSAVFSRQSSRFLTFQEERGKSLTDDDLLVLAMRSSIRKTI